MDHYREFQCSACDYYFSHPIDRCPICADQFFWLVIAHGDIREEDKRRYVVHMKNLGGAGVTEEFLTYRHRLWLPYNFWEVDPGGEILLQWPFVKEVKLYQHKKSRKTEDTESTARNATFDTNPALPIQESGAKPRPSSSPVQPVAMAAKAPMHTPLFKQPGMPHIPSSTGGVSAPGLASLSVREWLPPMLIFVFFMLMSLSFLVMRYYKNVRPVIVSTQVEAFYDHSVLS